MSGVRTALLARKHWHVGHQVLIVIDVVVCLEELTTLRAWRQGTEADGVQTTLLIHRYHTLTPVVSLGCFPQEVERSILAHRDVRLKLLRPLQVCPYRLAAVGSLFKNLHREDRRYFLQVKLVCLLQVHQRSSTKIRRLLYLLDARLSGRGAERPRDGGNGG